MYTFLRDTHLLLGLFLWVFVLFFGVSSIRFAHRDWFDAEPTVTELTVSVDPDQTATPRALARRLMAQEGYRGELRNIRETEESFRFNIGRIGTTHEIRYRRDGNQVLVKKRVFPFAGMLTWMHVTFGISHEYPLHNFWGWLMLLTSVGVLVLGVTGVYLWFKIYRERLVGSILLFGNLLFVAVTALLWLG
jgi:hypothetical protein